MAREDMIRKVMSSIYEIRGCGECGTRIRFGDIECSHCGADLEDGLREWAESLVDALSAGES